MRLALLALPLLTACSPEGRIFYQVYDLDQECRTEHQGLPPGMARGTCDFDLPGRSVFWSDDGRCWVGTRCTTPGDQPGYSYASEDDACFAILLNEPRWPRC